MVFPSVKKFAEDYDLLYKQAEEIFTTDNICQWGKNIDGSFSCIVNRVNSQKSNFRIIETDGCCIDICKNPGDFCDKAIRRKQHNAKKGCLVKSLKCKLHVCKQLRESNNPETREAIKNIEQLITVFRSKYDVVWKRVPYASSKKIWIEFYKKLTHKAPAP